MIRWFGDIIDRLFVVACAIVFAQAPLFIEQYTHRLSGHVAELNLQIDALKCVAAQSGKTLIEYTQKFLNSTDIDFVRQGELIQGMTQRLNRLSDALAGLTQASPLTRPFTFFKYFNGEIAKASLFRFQPGFSFTLETLCFGVVGMFFGYFLFSLVKCIISRIKLKKVISN